MSRIIAAFVVGVTLIGLAYGAAASLDVKPSSLQSGASASLICQGAGHDVTLEYKTARPGAVKVVAAVRASNIDAGCEGKAIEVDLLNSASALLGSAGGAVRGGATDWMTVAPGAAVPAVNEISSTFITIGDLADGTAAGTPGGR